MSDAIIAFDHVSRVYDMGHVQVPALADVSLAVVPGRIRRDRRAVRLRQDHDDEHHRLPRPPDRRRPTGSPGPRSPTSTTTASRDSAAARSASSSSPTTSCRGRRALENVATPLLYQGVSRRSERAAGDAPRSSGSGLGDRIHHEPTELSGGQQQRVAMARALRDRARADPRRRADRQPRQPLGRRGDGALPRAQRRRPDDRAHHPRRGRGRAGHARQVHLRDGRVVA